MKTLSKKFIKPDIQLCIMLALLVVIPFLFYYPSLSYDFLYELDDDWIIVHNYSIRMISYLGLQKGLAYLFFHDTTDFHYHPITYLSLSLDYLLFGASVTAIKVHNLILHITSGILLFIFLNLIVKNRWVSFITAMLFLVHPMNMESVAWASCRRQALFFSYFLGSAIMYKLFLENTGKRYNRWLYPLSLLLWIISMLAKASALVMPAVFILIYIHQHRNAIKLKIIIAHILPMVPVLFFIVYLNQQANDRNYLVRNFSYSGFDHIIFAGYTYCFYWIKGILPIHLVVFYPAPSENLIHLPVAYYLMFFTSCILLFLLVYHFVKKQNTLFFALGFYTVTILPMLDLIYYPLGDLPMLVADRYFYHTSIGILLYIVMVVYYAIKSNKIKIIIAGAYFTILAVLFKIQLPVWRDELAIYENTIKYYPSEEVLYKLAMLYDGLGESKKAIAYLNRADNLGTNIWVNNSWPFYQGRSRLYLKARKYDRAIKDINTALNKSFGKTSSIDSMLLMDKNNILTAIKEDSLKQK